MNAAAEICSFDAPDLQEKMRAILLAQLRIARAELDVVRNELDVIGGALRNRLLTPRQALNLAFERDVLDWLFRDREDAA